MEVLLESNIVLKSIKTDFATLELWEDDVVYVRVRGGVDITMQEVLILQPVIKELVADNDYYILLDSREDYTIDNDAREHIAHKGLPNRQAIAIVVKTISSRLTANFFMNFYKPSNPVKMFNDNASALEWIYKLRSM